VTLKLHLVNVQFTLRLLTSCAAGSGAATICPHPLQVNSLPERPSDFIDLFTLELVQNVNRDCQSHNPPANFGISEFSF